MTTLVRAALYLRVSTGRQAQSDLSIPDQRRQAKAYCKSRGWEIVADSCSRRCFERARLSCWSGAPPMIPVPGGARVLLATAYTDMVSPTTSSQTGGVPSASLK